MKNKLLPISQIVSIALMACAILFLLYYSFWMPYVLDDISYANVLQNHGFLKGQWVWIKKWNTRFTANLLMTTYLFLFDLLNDFNFSGIISVLLMGTVAADMTARYQKNNSIITKCFSFCLILTALIFSFQGSYSSIYWLSAAVAYTWGFFFFYWGWRFTFTYRNQYGLKKYLATLFFLLAIGSSETIMLLWFISYTAFLIDRKLRNKVNIYEWYSFLLTIAFIVFLINYSGYPYQVKVSPKGGMAGLFIPSFNSAKMIALLPFLRIILASLGVSFITLQLTRKKIIPRFSLKGTTLATLIVFVFFFGICFLGPFKTGWMTPPRVRSILFYFSFVILTQIFVQSSIFTKIPKNSILTALVCLLTPAYLLGTLINDPNSSLSLMINDTQNGTLTTFHYHQKASLRRLNRAKNTQTAIEISAPFEFMNLGSTQPIYEFYNPNPKHWYNHNLAQYFGLKSVSYHWDLFPKWLPLMKNYAPEYTESMEKKFIDSVKKLKP